MAYNLQSLITILQQILNPQQARWIVDEINPELQSLLKSAESLQQILENSSPTKIGSLEGRIRDAAYKAEDIIESHMVHQMLSNPEGVSLHLHELHNCKIQLLRYFVQICCGKDQLTFSTSDLRKIMQELDFAMEQVVKPMEGKTMSAGSSSSSGASFSHYLTPNMHQATQELESVKLVEVEGKKMPTGGPLWSSKKDLVGVEADLMQLKDRLTNMRSKLEIIPIVGMGGIGKSTLARNLYNDPDIVYHFDYRGWAAISQVYNMREILLSLLRDPNGKLSYELIECNENELKDILYQRLFGRRYMIVLDDIWTTKFWNEIRMYLPDNNNESRIMITTRESGLARFADSKSLHHDMQLLNESASWDLLRQVVFGEENYPLELQGIGTKIASDCDGLPLAIHVIGGLLSKVKRSRDVWEHISTDVRAALVESDEQFFNILSLSYDHLPVHLKPCFLYMGAFPEDYEIKGSRLMNIWIAEGFVKSNGEKSLEEEAQDYLKVLVERNLLYPAKEKKSNGQPMSYSIHDLLRDLCIRKAKEEKFLNVKNSMRRVSVHSSYEMEDVYASPQLMLLARSFICTDQDKIIFPVLRLVRVLDVMKMVFEKFPEEILELVNLRFLAFSCTSGLPIGISRLFNLQTLISPQPMPPALLSEILEMSELRYLRLRGILKIEEGYKIKFVHKKLQTLCHVWLTPSLIRSGFFGTIPNIIKLGIYYVDSPDIEVDLSHLHKLEILNIQCYLNEDGSRFLHNLIFPCNLRKLTLVQCVIFGSLLTTLCALPNLEVLKIGECVFERDGEAEEEWEATEGDEFRSLQFLCLQELNIVRWRADETNFPRLQDVVIINCYELEEIPCAIGDIPTLQLLDIFKCGASVVASAHQIQKVQQDEYDNYDLKVVITD